MLRLRPRRDEAFRLVMTAAEKAALERLAERDGDSQASILRRLLRREAQAEGAWFEDPKSAEWRGRPDSELPGGEA